MTIKYVCDICGEDTVLNPQTKPCMEEKMVDIEGKKIKVEVPKLSVTKRQNIVTGEIEDIPIQEVEDLQKRTYIVQLSVNQETIKKDFCKDCLKEIQPKIKELYDSLSKIKSK